MSFTKCICNKRSANNCTFKFCKKCCKNNYCSYHNNIDYTNIDISKCFMCKEEENNLTHLQNNLYFCYECYDNNIQLFSNLNIYINTTPPFVVSKTLMCICGNLCSPYCAIKSCKNCCDILGCKRHSEIVNQNNQEDILELINCCTFCGDNNVSLDKYINNFTNDIISYCKDCYDKYTNILNKLIFHNTTLEEKRLLNHTINIESIDTTSFNTFLNKFLNKIITNDDFKNNILPNPNFNLFSLNKRFSYECFKCLNIVNMAKTNICNNCSGLCCMDCLETTHVNCAIQNCNLCMNGYYTNSCTDEVEYLCKDCNNGYINSFTEKYSNTILTSQIISEFDENDNNNNLTISNSIFVKNIIKTENNLLFSCDDCNSVVPFSKNNIGKCDFCDDYICASCGISEYNVCDNTNCVICSNEDEFETNIANNNLCKFAVCKFNCKKCDTNDNNLNSNLNSDSDLDNSDSDSEETEDLDSNNSEESEDITNMLDNIQNYLNGRNQENIVKKRSNSICELAMNEAEQCNICYTNKKTYACIPCGHLCVCGNCANKIKNKCPICNTKSATIVKIYQ